MTPHPFIILITGLLILLWAYAAFSKIFNFHKFSYALKTQVFPPWVGKILLYLLPLVETAFIVLLLVPGTRLLGMYASLFLMVIFTLYVGGAVFQFYERYPCACGGLFARMGWHKHFKVNIMLTIIALAGVILMEL
ncbi:MauE/DoxX family redox-associated membrane protein [Pedobacter hartonius]|uniref:Methylamine utilisation protein MauE n=1 Tax=Pedobacter hartonius TaxID=425514 RepID=A0A1H4HJ43_9SPHI|nr:MauE/DoxX family redox-associated membrane protein [Pedobacter hartonius]SEB21701.1 Methylamine utilisation protein MauE [Pedobacter hartonius]